MSGTLNKVMLIGRLGKDPETKSVGDRELCKFSIATDESWTKDGEKHSKTTWHNLVCWGKLAEISGKFLKKGSSVYVEGKIENREWEDKDGSKKRATDIIIDRMVMLGKKEEGDGAKPAAAKKAKDDWGSAGGSAGGSDDEDIPF